jgi:hypothetical protein
MENVELHEAIGRLSQAMGNPALTGTSRIGIEVAVINRAIRLLKELQEYKAMYEGLCK